MNKIHAIKISIHLFRHIVKSYMKISVVDLHKYCFSFPSRKGFFKSLCKNVKKVLHLYTVCAIIYNT